MELRYHWRFISWSFHLSLQCLVFPSVCLQELSINLVIVLLSRFSVSINYVYPIVCTPLSWCKGLRTPYNTSIQDGKREDGRRDYHTNDHSNLHSFSRVFTFHRVRLLYLKENTLFVSLSWTV